MTEQPSKKFNFTKAAIDALPVTDKRVFYYDTGERGLCVLVEPTGRKTFYLYRKTGRTTKQLKLGVYPDMPVPQARDKAKMLNVAIVTGEKPERVRGGQRGEETLVEVFAWYLEAHAKPRKRPRTVALDEMAFKLYFGPLKNKTLTAITRQDVRRWHTDLVKDKGAATANKAITLLSSIYGRAIAHDKWEGVSPCQRVEKAPEQARDRRLMPGEIADFLAALDADLDQDMKDYFYLSLFTGQRRGNVLAMRWDEIDFVGGIWRIPMTKNGLPHHVPLGVDELRILEERKGNGSPWVFPGRGKTGHIVEPKKAWRRILDRANEERAKREEPPISDLRIHDLRRTLGSYMVDTGASLHVVGKTLGHQNQATTAIYARLSLDPVRHAKRAAIDAMRPPKAND